MDQPFEPSKTRVAVIGAGIVGASVLLQLQRQGFRTSLFDGQAPGSGASFGNAGLISVDSCIPIALPGMLKQVPGWLLSRRGPLSIDYRDLPAALPWLLRWVWQSRASQVEPCSHAMLLLHRPALALYRTLLGQSEFDRLIHIRGQLHVWESDGVSGSERLETQLRQIQGIQTETLTGSALHERSPGLSAAIKRGLWFGRHAHVLNPQHLVQSLVDLACRAGAQVHKSEVGFVVPSAQGGYDLQCAGARFHAEVVVVCTGIRGNELLAPLGVRIPLQAERGYHLHVPNAQGSVVQPVVNRSRGLVLTPMSDGLRVAGLVEIADWRRAASPVGAERLAAGVSATLKAPPAIDNAAHWVGARPSTPDNLPVIDAVRGRAGLFLACGHSHFGLSSAGMTGQLIVDRLLARAPSVDDRPFRLARFH